MIQIAEGIWQITYGMPERFTPVSMRSHEIAWKGLERLAADVKAVVRDACLRYRF